MRLNNYMGAEGTCIVIESPNDLYAALDFLHSEMMGIVNDTGSERAERCADLISKFMDEAEIEGFGSVEDLE